MLRQRILVAAVFLPCFVWMIFTPNPLFFLLFAVAGLAATVLEVQALVRQRGVPFHGFVALPAVVLMGLVSAFPAWLPKESAFSTTTALFIILIAVLLVLSLQAIVAGATESSFPAIAFTFFAVALLGGVGSFLIRLRLLPDGSWWVALLFGFNWLYDAGAYFTGKRFGRHKLAPTISPKKTVEGFVGGLVVNVIAAGAVHATLLPATMGFDLPAFLLLAGVLGVLAQVGDLTESILKRWSGSRHSAGVIPGHGGILDKIDSAFFTAPLLYVVALWVSGT